MPVLRFKPGRVEEALRLPLREALAIAERLKIEVGQASEGYVEFEIEVDRPDMYSLEGIARQVDGLLERRVGLAEYTIVDSGFKLRVEHVSSRPYIAAAVIWDVNVDEDYLEELIQFQEKLHLSHCRNRERAAIGLHDLDKVPSRQLIYREAGLDEIRFKPLGGEREMSIREVLSETEQGRKYGSISLNEGRHPVLLSGDDVISLPPVINSELTRIEPGTKHILVDVTGTDKRLVLDILSIIAANLAERSSSRCIGVVEVEAPWGRFREPTLKPWKMSIEPSYVSGLLGAELAAEEVAAHLRRMRFGAQPREAIVDVLVPRYRVDILHPADLAEEVALSIGIGNLEPKKPSLMLRGRLLGRRPWERQARIILVGLGFVEVIGYSLVECQEHSRLSGVPLNQLVKIQNPVGPESACLRASLLPQLLRLAARNQHRIPVRAFELGEALRATGEGETGVRQENKLAIIMVNNKVGYEDIQAVVYTLIRLLGDEVVRIESMTHPSMIEGRTAALETRMGIRALLGEVKPEVLEKLGIEYPVAAAELDYTGLRVPRP